MPTMRRPCTATRTVWRRERNCRAVRSRQISSALGRSGPYARWPGCAVISARRISATRSMSALVASRIRIRVAVACATTPSCRRCRRDRSAGGAPADARAHTAPSRSARSCGGATSASSTSSHAATLVCGVALRRQARAVHEVEQRPGRPRTPRSSGSLAASSGTCSAPPVVEPHHDVVGVRRRPARAWKVASAARRISSRAIDLAADELALVLELDLAGDRGQRRVDVGDARHHLHSSPLARRDARRSTRRSRAR